ncbi:hypothetical protein AaE_014805 [Aphanomyces astaci]|uniref:Tc1-like transposase DDE domain-containing protein n=1 Tax=Aphanomyces astaci TaxID=112090 RepID=A0A6A4Z3Q2_APHAT|nr:hypothetical protein AaE_014805 [Aphanomyces astaci]
MLVRWVEFDSQITLEEIKDRFMLDLEIEVSKSTLHRELDKRVYTFKSVHYEPLQMNDPTFKGKRREYVQQLRDLLGQGKIPIWIDETNFNLFTSRTKARSLRGRRAVFIRGGTQKGKNLHQPDANEWIRGMLGAATNHYGGLQDILVIADNAPCHSRLENVFAEDEFRTATLLRLAPYSPMMNPIENLWSQFKAHVKALLRERLTAFMCPPPRWIYSRGVSDAVSRTYCRRSIEPNLLSRFALRLEYFYGRADRMEDMEVGI